MVKNVAEEVSNGVVRKNWVARFARRHAAYLRTIDNACVKADNILLITQIYNQVNI